jgi:hypothetical protein
VSISPLKRISTVAAGLVMCSAGITFLAPQAHASDDCRQVLSKIMQRNWQVMDQNQQGITGEGIAQGNDSVYSAIGTYAYEACERDSRLVSDLDDAATATWRAAEANRAQDVQGALTMEIFVDEKLQDALTVTKGYG